MYRGFRANFTYDVNPIALTFPGSDVRHICNTCVILLDVDFQISCTSDSYLAFVSLTCTIDCQQHSTATTMRQIHQSAVSACTSLHSDAAADNARFACKTNHIRLPTLACVCVDITQLFQHVRLAVEVFCRHTGARKLVPVILLGCRRKVPAK